MYSHVCVHISCQNEQYAVLLDMHLVIIDILQSTDILYTVKVMKRAAGSGSVYVVVQFLNWLNFITKLGQYFLNWFVFFFQPVKFGSKGKGESGTNNLLDQQK